MATLLCQWDPTLPLAPYPAIGGSDIADWAVVQPDEGRAQEAKGGDDLSDWNSSCPDGCGTGPQSVSHSIVTPWPLSRSPKLSLHVSAGCPASLVHYEDVVNTFPGPPLVPQAAPVSGLVCWYNGSNTPDPASLGRQVRLGSQEAAC